MTAPKRVLLTGMSGTGKSSAVLELARRGHRAVDLDHPDWSGRAPDGDWVWREERVSELLDTDASPYLFLSGCAENQVRFYDRLDAIVLLSAPTDLLLHRLATRTNNDYGKRPEEVADVLGYVETVEPRLRRGAHLEIDTSASLGSVVERLLGFVGAPRYVRVDAAAPAGSVP